MERFTDHLLFVSDYERRRLPPQGRRADAAEQLGLQRPARQRIRAGCRRAGCGGFSLHRHDARPQGSRSASSMRWRRSKCGSAGAVSAVMVGDGDDLPRYQAQVRTAWPEDRVAFLEPMPARQAFALANTVVVPSRAEATMRESDDVGALREVPPGLTVRGGLKRRLLRTAVAGRRFPTAPKAGSAAEGPCNWISRQREVVGIIRLACRCGLYKESGKQVESPVSMNFPPMMEAGSLCRWIGSRRRSWSNDLRSNHFASLKGFVTLFCHRRPRPTDQQQHRTRSSRGTAFSPMRRHKH